MPRLISNHEAKHLLKEYSKLDHEYCKLYSHENRDGLEKIDQAYLNNVKLGLTLLHRTRLLNQHSFDAFIKSQGYRTEFITRLLELQSKNLLDTNSFYRTLRGSGFGQKIQGERFQQEAQPIQGTEGSHGQVFRIIKQKTNPPRETIRYVFISTESKKDDKFVADYSAVASEVLRLVSTDIFPKVRVFTERIPGSNLRRTRGYLSAEIEGYSTTWNQLQLNPQRFMNLLDNNKRELAALFVATYFTAENDLHSGNWGISSSRKIKKIDNDMAFFNHTARYKDMSEGNFHAKEVKKFPNIIYNRNKSFELTTYDIETLPVLNFAKPCNWPDKRLGDYAAQLSKNPEFTKFKWLYFTKLLLVQERQIAHICNAHSLDTKNSLELQSYLNNRLQNLKTVLLASPEYCDFVATLKIGHPNFDLLTKELENYDKQFAAKYPQIQEGRLLQPGMIKPKYYDRLFGSFEQPIVPRILRFCNGFKSDPNFNNKQHIYNTKNTELTTAEHTVLETMNNMMGGLAHIQNTRESLQQLIPRTALELEQNFDYISKTKGEVVGDRYLLLVDELKQIFHQQNLVNRDSQIFIHDQLEELHNRYSTNISKLQSLLGVSTSSKLSLSTNSIKVEEHGKVKSYNVAEYSGASQLVAESLRISNSYLTMAKDLQAYRLNAPILQANVNDLDYFLQNQNLIQQEMQIIRRLHDTYKPKHIDSRSYDSFARMVPKSKDVYDAHLNFLEKNFGRENKEFYRGEVDKLLAIHQQGKNLNELRLQQLETPLTDSYNQYAEMLAKLKYQLGFVDEHQVDFDFKSMSVKDLLTGRTYDLKSVNPQLLSEAVSIADKYETLSKSYESIKSYIARFSEYQQLASSSVILANPATPSTTKQTPAADVPAVRPKTVAERFLQPDETVSRPAYVNAKHQGSDLSVGSIVDPHDIIAGKPPQHAKLPTTRHDRLATKCAHAAPPVLPQQTTAEDGQLGQRRGPKPPKV